MKKGELSWEYLAVIVILLILLVIMTLFSKTMKEQAVEGINRLLSIFQIGE